MIAFDEAHRKVLSATALQPIERVASMQAVDRVLAREVISSCQLPPFDNSAMDGFALRCPQTGLAAGAEFAVTGLQAAGDSAVESASEGCCEIMTGARLPEGFNAVVPVEQVEILGADDAKPSRIRLSTAVSIGQHIRKAGEDVAAGEKIIDAGTRLDSRHVMVLAGLGIVEVDVRRRLKAAVLCTGRELVDDPAQVLLSGQIRNCNGPYLALRLRQAGAELVFQATVADDEAAYIAALQSALQAGAEILISTGAVSMGRYDFVPSALRSFGAEILFHKVAMRPGKPLLSARLSGGQLLFGLPGNPVSSAVGLRFFIEPALRAAYGQLQEQAWRLPLLHAAKKNTGLRHMQKAMLSVDGRGQLGVSLLAGQESFKTKPLLTANAWAVLPEAVTALPAGTLVDVFPLDHETAPAFENPLP